jgi:hypothetical protein
LQSHQNESARLSTPRFSKWKQIQSGDGSLIDNNDGSAII